MKPTDFDNIDEYYTYYEGIKKGIHMYGWWKDGIQYVGTCGITLKEALNMIDKERDSQLPIREFKLVPFNSDNPFKGDN